MEPDDATLLDLERGFWRAAGREDAYERNLARDALHVFPGLGVVDRAAVLAGVAGAPPWESFTIDDPRVVRLVDDAVVLVYTTRAARGSEPYRGAITSVYRRRAGGWELVVHQQTALDT